MISFLRGVIFSKGTQEVVLDVNGVGYAVTMPSRSVGALGPVGSEVLVYTAMQVKEDGVALFGFSSEEERFVYEKLITVSSVGPKMAISALSTYSAQELMGLIAAEDSAGVSKIPGVGKKTAQRIIIDLKSAFAGLGVAAGDPLESQAGAGDTSEAVQALLAMGFTMEEAQLAVKGYTGSNDASELVRYALKRLGGV